MTDHSYTSGYQGYDIADQADFIDESDPEGDLEVDDLTDDEEEIPRPRASASAPLSIENLLLRAQTLLPTEPAAVSNPNPAAPVAVSNPNPAAVSNPNPAAPSAVSNPNPAAVSNPNHAAPLPGSVSTPVTNPPPAPAFREWDADLAARSLAARDLAARALAARDLAAAARDLAAQARQDPLPADVAAPTAVTNPLPAPPHPGVVAAPAPPLPGVVAAPAAAINLPAAPPLSGVVAAPAAVINLPPAAPLPGAIRRRGAPAPGRVYHRPPPNFTMEQRAWIVIHFLQGRQDHLHERYNDLRDYYF